MEPQTLRIPPRVLGGIVGHALIEYPKESVGVIAGARHPHWTPTRYVALLNVARTPETRFAVNGNQQLRVWSEIAEAGLSVLVACHSHTVGRGEPSERDIEQHDPNLLMLIVDIVNPVRPQFGLYRVDDVGYFYKMRIIT